MSFLLWCGILVWYLFNECRFLDQCTLVKFVSATTSNVVWTPGDVSAVVREKSHSQFAMHMCLGSAGILNWLTRVFWLQRANIVMGMCFYIRTYVCGCLSICRCIILLYLCSIFEVAFIHTYVRTYITNRLGTRQRTIIYQYYTPSSLRERRVWLQ